MKVVLLKDVPNVGLEGDVREVSDGYARNFLLPKKLAVSATREALAESARIKKERAHAAELDLSRAEDLAARLDDFELEMHEKANDSGTLFAAVTAKKIATALKTKGMTVPEKMIILEHPLKEVGEHQVRCELPHGLEATLRVIINPSG